MIGVIIAGIVILVFGFVVFRGAPYVPSQKKYVRQAFSELYPLGESDVLVDVGSGDGIVLRLAREHGAHAIGYELNPVLVALSRWLSRGDDAVRVVLADFWTIELPDDTTIVYGFMVTRDMAKMVNKLQQEANRLGRPLLFMTYGNMVAGMTAEASVAAYHLYQFYPLHTDEA
jgi:SAM-dependent methyltransferase